MADDNPSDLDPVDDEPPKPPVRTPDPKKPAPPPRDEDLPTDPEEMKEYVSRIKKQLSVVQRENNERKRRQDDIDRQEEERKNATLGESERLKKEAKDAANKATEAERRATAAEERLVKEQIDAAVEREAVKLGFEYPDITPQLIDRTRVEKDEETGKITGVKEALERLAKERPNLVAASPRGGTPPREGPRRTGDRDQRGKGESNPFEDELRRTGKYV